MTTPATRPAPRVGARDIAAAIDPDRLPTPEQQAMIEASFTPLLVVAGAGAGKTETMSQRVLYAVANGEAAPAEVLGLTFTRKAAGELSERVRHRLRSLRASGLWRPDRPGVATTGTRDDAAEVSAQAELSPLDADRPHITTYNAFAADLVAEFALRLGEDPGAQLMTEARRWQLAESVVLGWEEDLSTDTSLSSIVSAVLSLSGALDEHLLTPREAAALLDDLADGFTIAKKDTAPTDTEVSLRVRADLMELVAAFRTRAREEGLVDFGGQVALATRLATELPEVREAVRDRYPVVMLDEYQDTSVAQVELLSALFGDGHAVTAVGDPQQAIYGWRGASASAMSQFHGRFRSAGHHPATLTMSTSWRNDEAVLALANHVAGPPAPDDPLPPNPLGARPGAGPGEVLHHRAEDREAEAAAVAQWLAAGWQREVEAARAAGSTDVPSAAVLCRTRGQFPDLTRALDELDVPHRVVGLGGLLQDRDVADVRAALAVVADPERGDAAVHLLHRARLGAKDLVALHEYATDLARLSLRELGAEGMRARDEATLVEALSRPLSADWRGRDGQGLGPEALERLARLRAVLDDLRRRRNLPLGELVAYTQRRLGLDVEAASRPAGEGGRAALDAFTQVAVSFAADAPEATLTTFLGYVDELERNERLETPEEDLVSDGDAVLIMTVHAAKGLEWDHVAVPGWDEGRLPSYRSMPDAETGVVKDSAWLTSLGALPYPMRGDAEDLPRFGVDTEGMPVGDHPTKTAVTALLDEYKEACGRHAVREERHVAYVAVTRARRCLLVTSSRTPHRKVERPESRFLPRAESGLLSEFPAVAPPERAGGDAQHRAWPSPLLRPSRLASVQAVAARLQQVEHTEAASSDEADPRWEEARLLLAERDEAARAAADGRGEPLPDKLTVTTLVRAGADPDDVARDLLRPVPREPSYVVTRGTSLHAWIEQHYTAPALRSREDGEDLLDSLEPDLVGTADVRRLQQAFLGTEWSRRVPVGIEVDLTEVVDGRVVPGVADAVFDDEHGCVVVDWKTGRRPTGRARRARDMQLHLYRLAWSRRTRRPIEEIGGSFVHLDATTGKSVADEVERWGEDEVLAFARSTLARLEEAARSLAGERRESQAVERAEPERPADGT